MNVPFLDLKAQYKSIQPAIDEAIASVLHQTAFIGGAAVSSFEAAFAKAHGAKHCIGVANGTDALFVIFRSLGLSAGDHVVVPANSFIASSEAVTQAGGRPLFVDCNDDCTIDLDALEALLLAKKKEGVRVAAILPVHLYGRVCDMTRLLALGETYGVRIVEDCAQAHLGIHAGRSVGSFGVAAAFSFYPGKNLGAYGDAGAITTNDDALAEKMRMFANHGRKAKYDHEFEGINSRLDGLQAAILNVKLSHLGAWTYARIAHAKAYDERLSKVAGLTLPSIPQVDREHVFHLYVIQTDRREHLREALKNEGIETGVHYPIALPNLQAYRHLETPKEQFAKAASLESKILSLPLFPELTVAQIDHVSSVVTRALA